MPQKRDNEIALAYGIRILLVKAIATAHCGSETYHPALDMEQWRMVMPDAVWREILNQFTDDSEAVEALCQHTRTGRAIQKGSKKEENSRNSRRIRSMHPRPPLVYLLGRVRLVCFFRLFRLFNG